MKETAESAGVEMEGRENERPQSPGAFRVAQQRIPVKNASCQEDSTRYVSFQGGQLVLVNNSSMTVTGAIGIGATGLSAGTLVVRSTSTTALNPVINVQNNTGTELLRVQQDGNVGIGLSAPGTQLDVAGNAAFGSGTTKSAFTASGFWEPFSRTRAQIDVLVPTKIGQVIYASDTTLPGLCISTGTAAAQWRKMESATLGCGTNN